MKNKIMLITYADSFGKNLKELKYALDTWFTKEVASVHILPFFPSSGDRGFAPMDYTKVDPDFGDWEDVEAIAANRELMFDFMINHLSRRSPEFLDFIEKHDASPYADMFLRFQKFWPGGYPSKEQVDLLNKRKPCAPCEEIVFADGTGEKIWCTFDSEQMDLNLESETAWNFVRRSLRFLMDHGASMIRLDAFAFATKKRNTACFFVEPEMWEMMKKVQDILDEKQIPMLPEIHDRPEIQLKIAEHGYAVYDFVLPVMVLHTLYKKSSARIKHWLTVCPKNQHTTLDTHDGLGTVDVAGLMSGQELADVIEQTSKYGANFKWDYSADSLGQKRVYQINCSYYSAVGEDDDRYLLSRAIQFFTPGVPQVYYMGLLAGENDYELMERTNFSRNISRHNYTLEEIGECVKKPVVKKLCSLMRFRNEYPVFDGQMNLPECRDDKLLVEWQDGRYWALLDADLSKDRFVIRYLDENGDKKIFEPGE